MQIQIEKPRLGVPVSLIVDDPTPCINPLFYFRLQVDRQHEIVHERLIPLAFLEQFIAVCRERGIRGKFSIIPYPAGLGSIVEGWPECTPDERERWLDLVRAELAPDFDITPEILTHTLALDLQTRCMLPEPEHIWMEERTEDELERYFAASLQILRDAGFAPSGITQPCYFNGPRAGYDRAVLAAIRASGGPPATFYFADFYQDAAPFPEPEVVLLDRERGEGVVNIPSYTDDYFWRTQRPWNEDARTAADRFITADGSAGRLAELARDNAWLIFVCHWQTLYSDGRLAGLRGLDTVAERLARVHGPRLHWMTLSEVARYRAASESCVISLQPDADGLGIRLESPFDCPAFTFSLDAPSGNGAAGDRAQLDGIMLAPAETGATLMTPGTLRTEQGRRVFCINLARGAQLLRIEWA